MTFSPLPSLYKCAHLTFFFSAALGKVTVALQPGETAASVTERLNVLTEIEGDRITITTDRSSPPAEARGDNSALWGGGAQPDHTFPGVDLAAALAESGGGVLTLHVAASQLSSLVVTLPSAFEKRLGRRLALAVSDSETIDSLKDKVRQLPSSRAESGM